MRIGGVRVRGGSRRCDDDCECPAPPGLGTQLAITALGTALATATTVIVARVIDRVWPERVEDDEDAMSPDELAEYIAEKVEERRREKRKRRKG